MSKENKEVTMENDEVNLIDYIKVIIKRRYIIWGVILIGIIIAAFSHFTTPKVYQATGYYREIKVTKRFFFNPAKTNLKQLIAEAKIKHPSIDISIPKDIKIITIKTVGATPQEAKLECLRIAESLPIEEIVAVSSKLLESKKTSRTLIIASSIFLAFFLAFLKEWIDKNWRDICGR